MKRKTITFGESNVAVIFALITMTVGALGYAVLIAVTTVLLGREIKVPDWIVYLFSQGLLFFGAWAYLTLFRRANYFSLFEAGHKTLNKKKLVLLPFIAIFAILLFSPFADLFVWAIESLGFSSESGIELNTPISFIMSVVCVAVIPAINEEMLFRGVLMNGARGKRGSFFAVIYTAIVFMLFHTNPLQTVHQLLLGLLFGYIAVTSGNILYGIILHFLNNLIAICLIFIPSLSTASAYAAIIMYGGFLAIGAAGLYFSMREFKRLNDAEFGLKKGENLFSRFFKKDSLKKDSIKAYIAEFDAKYDALNRFNEAIPDDVPFSFGMGEDKKYPTSSKLILIGCAGLWLLVLAFGILSGI